LVEAESARKRRPFGAELKLPIAVLFSVDPAYNLRLSVYRFDVDYLVRVVAGIDREILGKTKSRAGATSTGYR